MNYFYGVWADFGRINICPFNGIYTVIIILFIEHRMIKYENTLQD